MSRAAEATPTGKNDAIIPIAAAISTLFFFIANPIKVKIRSELLQNSFRKQLKFRI